MAIGKVTVLIGLLAQLLFFGAAHAQERRVALVIGNSAYRNAPVLPNTVNDAQDMVVSLRKVGFEVVDGFNLDKRGMDSVLTRFARLAQDADAVLFYYAGHGFQFNGENYLVPVEARIDDEVGVQYETTRLADVLTALSFAKGVKIMVLDACRNNPFVNQLAKRQATRGFAVGSGLAPIARAQGMVIAYATQANDVAADGAGRNSPFTAALVREIEQPGLEVGTLFRRVQRVVYDATGGRQTPELSLSLLGDFYLNRAETDADVWRRIRDGGDASALQDFVRRYPTSFFAADAKARLDLIERRGAEISERERLAREFAERERVLLERLARAERERQKAASDLVGRDKGETEPTPGQQAGPLPAAPAARPSAVDPGERERLAQELARRERELAALESEQRRLGEERLQREQAMAARINAAIGGSLTLAPAKPVLPTLAPRQEPGEKPAATRPPQVVIDRAEAAPEPPRIQDRGRPAASRPADCGDLLMRAQLGEVGPATMDALRRCR